MKPGHLPPAEAVKYAYAMDAQGEDAELVVRSVLKIEPKNFLALNLLGCILSRKEQLYEALYRLGQAMKIKKREPVLMGNYGVVLGQLGDFEEGEYYLRTAIHIQPKNPVLWGDLVNLLDRAGRYAEALDASRKAVALDPSDPRAWSNRGIVLRHLNRNLEALDAFEQSLAIDGTHPETNYNHGIVSLALGRFMAGWRGYEWRLKNVGADKVYYMSPAAPKWTGVEDLAGKAILVHAEQGIGDAIQFIRYVPKLIERAGKVVVVVHSAVVGLVREMLGEKAEVLSPTVTQADGTKAPRVLDPHDFYIPLMSLPLAFETFSESLIPPPIRVDISRPQGGRRIGVCWSGNWIHANDAHRSIPLKKLAPFLRLDGIEFVSLQKEVRQMDEVAFADLGLVDGVSDCETMLDTAGVIGGLDLVISVDTAVAHLAGTLGVPTWVLLPAQTTDWRWMHDRADSPWYPSMRLFRQPKVGDWESVILLIRNELRPLSARAA